MPRIKSFFPRKDKDNINRRIELFVKILMKLSSDTYWIGDDTGTCQMKLDSKLMDTLAMTKSQLIEEGKSYRL